MGLVGTREVGERAGAGAMMGLVGTREVGERAGAGAMMGLVLTGEVGVGRPNSGTGTSIGLLQQSRGRGGARSHELVGMRSGIGISVGE